MEYQICGTPSGSTFMLGFEGAYAYGPSWRPRLFSHRKWPKIQKMKNNHHNIDFSSGRPGSEKWLWRNRCYDFIFGFWFLGHNLWWENGRGYHVGP